MSRAPASNSVTASNGKTSVVVIDPRIEMPSPNHTRQKLRLPASRGMASATGSGPECACVVVMFPPRGHGCAGKPREKT